MDEILRDEVYNEEEEKKKPKEEDNDVVFVEEEQGAVGGEPRRQKPQMAIRGYWAGKRRVGRNEECGARGKVEEAKVKGEDVETEADNISGVKRKGSDKENPKDKARRLSSPRPMSVDTLEVEPGSSSASNTDQTAPMAELPSSPPSERDPIAASPALQLRTGEPEGREDQGGQDESGPARRYLNQQNTVHLIFPLEDVRVPVYLRRGFRPVHPFPFTGQVNQRHRNTVRRRLEMSWRLEAQNVQDATDRNVAALMQMRAYWYWENGWRISRVNGTWGYYGDSGDEDFVGHLNAESEITGPMREEAQRRLANLKRQEEELSNRGPVYTEDLCRLIWDNLQSIRRAYRQMGLNGAEQQEAGFRENSYRPVYANGPHGPVNVENFMPGRAPSAEENQDDQRVDLGPLPLQVEAHQAVNRRLDEELQQQDYLVRNCERMVQTANRMVAQAEELNLASARRRAAGELRAAVQRLEGQEDERERVRRAQTRARQAAARQGINCEEGGNRYQHADRDDNVPIVYARFRADQRPLSPPPRPNVVEARFRNDQGGQRRQEAGAVNWRNGARQNDGGQLFGVRGRGGNRGGRNGRKNRGGRRDQGRREGQEQREPRERSGARSEAGGDPWRTLQAQKAQNPAVFEWRRRVRVMELQMMESHPQREHIRRVLESEEEAAVADARALIRSQELTGAQTSFDISWPPSKAVTVKFGKPGRDRNEDTETDDTEDENNGRIYGAVPPPNCGFYRGRGGPRGGRGGQGGAQQLGY